MSIRVYTRYCVRTTVRALLFVRYCSSTRAVTCNMSMLNVNAQKCTWSRCTYDRTLYYDYLATGSTQLDLEEIKSLI